MKTYELWLKAQAIKEGEASEWLTLRRELREIAIDLFREANRLMPIHIDN